MTEWKIGTPKLTEDKVVEIRNRYADGERQQDLADEYDVSLYTISSAVNGKIWKNAGGPITNGRERGGNFTLLSRNRKFDVDDVLKIREMYRNNTPVEKIAELYKTRVETIRDIVSGVSWSKVGSPVPA